MSVIATYSCDKLRLMNKVGDLPVDDGGYREMLVGAFDCFNARGELYDFADDIKAMFDRDGDLQRRVRNSKFRGEIEHPMPLPGQSIDSYLARLSAIRLDRASHPFGGFRLLEMKDHTGRNIVGVMARVAPSGGYGHVLERMFKNREENIDFSVRAMSKRYEKAGQVHKLVTGIITYDLVNEGGIAVANKFDSPALESLDGQLVESVFELNFSEADLAKAEVVQQAYLQHAGIESEGVGLTYVRQSCGWTKLEIHNPKSPIFW